MNASGLDTDFLLNTVMVQSYIVHLNYEWDISPLNDIAF